MQITDDIAYDNFKLKFGIDALSETDDVVLKLWLLGNEVIRFKENTSYEYFLVGLGTPGSADKYREFRLFKYDTTIAKVTEDNIFKCKNSVLTENIDLFEHLFAYFSK